MPDDPDRKKSLREQVEEYKRRQREAEAEAKQAAAEDDDSDLEEPEESDEADEADEAFEREWAKNMDPVAAAAEARKSGASVVKIVSAVFLVVGLILLLVAAGTFVHIRRSVAAETSVDGVVVRNVVRPHTTRDSNSSRSTTTDYYHAVVEFPLADGTKKTVEMAEGNWPKAWEEGERVRVRYDPDKPLNARLGGGTAMDFFVSLLTGFLGFVFTAVAIGVKRAFGSA
jgi:hypothetical protein